MEISKIYEAIQARQQRIQPDDVENLLKENKLGLTIVKSEIVGKTREGVLLHFKETTLKHKCNRTDVFAIANKYNIEDTDLFVGKKVFLETVEINENEFVRIKA